MIGAADCFHAEGRGSVAPPTIPSERADESQQVQREVHPERSRVAIASARSVIAVESKSGLAWLLSWRGWVFGRDRFLGFREGQQACLLVNVADLVGNVLQAGGPRAALA